MNVLLMFLKHFSALKDTHKWVLVSNAECKQKFNLFKKKIP